MRIYTKIVGDLFHPGHVSFLKSARAWGGHLTVCVVPDDRVAQLKRRPIMTVEERKVVVAACRYVDAVISDGPRVITRSFMAESQYDIYAFGAADDAELVTKLADCADLPETMRVRIPYSPGISTSLLIDRIRDRAGSVPQ